jgi:PKD repeat protein
VSGGNIDEFEIAPSNTNYIYVAINTALYRSTNGGSTWTTVTPTGSLAPGNNILGIAIDPQDEEHIAITIGGYSSNMKALESTDGGASWSNISSGLPNVPATCVLFEGTTSNGIYVGTDIGVYYKSAAFSSWISFNKNLPNVIVTDFELYEDGDLLRIGTFGRGVWQSPTMASFNTAPVANFSIEPSAPCSTADTVSLVDASSGIPTDWHWEITPNNATFVGGTTDSSASPKVLLSAPGTYTVKLTVSNTYGSTDTTLYQAINVGGRALPFTEDFESGQGLWTIENPDNGVTWSMATIGGTTPGNTAMKVDHFNYTGSGQLDALISEPLSFANDTLVSLDFEYSYRTYQSTYKDSLKVYVSDDCGASWTLVAAYGEGGTDAWATDVPISSSWTPTTSSDWCIGSSSVSCPSIDLNAYSGQTGIRVKFETVNAYGNNFYLDNINISGQALSAPVASFTGDSTSCTAVPIVFADFSSPTPTTRTWYFQGGTPATSTDANPSVSYAVAGTYDVTLVVSNSAGTDSAFFDDYVNITAAPAATVTVTPSAAAFCAGDTASFTSTVLNGGTSPMVEWFVNGLKKSTSANFSAVLNHGDQVVAKLISSDVCTSPMVAYDTLVVNVNTLPSVSLGSQGYVCQLGGLQTLSGGLPVGGQYSGNGISNGQIDPQLAGVGSHWVYYTYTDPVTGCANTAKRAISVQPAPGKPTVSQDPSSGELVAGTPLGTFSYQWLDAAQGSINGANSGTYMPPANGDYYVKITSSIQCSNVSDAFAVNNIGVEELAEVGFELFPNPAHAVFTVKVKGMAEIRIFGSNGQLVWSATVAEQSDVDVSQWARGSYMVQLQQSEQVYTIPLILQ